MLGYKSPFRTVNAARRHYDQPVEARAQADPESLARLTTRREPPEDWPSALRKRPEDIDVVDVAAAT